MVCLPGLVTGFGAATADALYCLVAALGLTFISSFLIEQQFYLTVLGTCFLAYLGIKTYRTPPAQTAAHIHGPSGWVGMYFATLFLTLSNPMTFIAFTAIFASFGLAAEGNIPGALVIVSGVFLGSTLWWFILETLFHYSAQE